MPSNKTHYNVFISHPSDVDKEVQITKDAIDHFNHLNRPFSDIFYDFVEWNTDVHPDSGGDPQSIINKQIAEDCDILIAILKQRYGNPTPRYDSGTEEEIFDALDAGKKVLLYCWDPPRDFKPDGEEQFAKIAALKKKVSGRAVYSGFKDADDFKGQVEFALTRISGELAQDAKLRALPNLSIMSITSDKMLEGHLQLVESPVKSFFNMGWIRGNVESLVSEAASIELPKEEEGKQLEEINGIPDAEDSIFSIKSNLKILEVSDQIKGLQKIAGLSILESEPVSINPDETALITATLNDLSIGLPDGLFYLGNLGRSQVLATASLYGNRDSLTGSDDEKKKYRTLKELIRNCRLYWEIKNFASQFEKLSFIGLVLGNTGQTPASHVEITLRFPKGSLLSLEEVPIPENEMLGTFEEELPERLFGIKSTDEFDDYDETVVRAESGVRMPYMPQPKINPFPGPNSNASAFDAEEYHDVLEAVFGDYRIVDSVDGKETCLKLVMDCARHGKRYAFPTYLLAQTEKVGSIKYEIRCDNLPDIIEGEFRTEQSSQSV